MLSLVGIAKQYGSKVLFEGADVQIGHRSRIALIGANGAGKSTLIRILLGQEFPDSGQVVRAKHLLIGHLAQEVPKFEGGTILAEVMRLDGRRQGLRELKTELEASLSELESASPEVIEAVLERYGRVLEELELIDEYRMEARAKEILLGMGFQVRDFERELTEFSGGWLMRVALARILLMEADLLLLDEPTNHLDLESVLWLEGFLKNYRGALLLVSHDALFLNQMVNEVLEIDQRKIVSYRGNLDQFHVQKVERVLVLQAQYAAQQSKIAEIEKFVDRFGAKASKARQAQSRVKQLEKMERIELPEDRSKIQFRFPPVERSGREVVTLKAAGLRFGEKRLFHSLDWVIQRGARCAIVGANGVGKTTLLRLLSGHLEPTEGDMHWGHGVKIGYYAQLQAESLALEKTVLEELESVAPGLPISQVRGIAGAFLFSGDAVHKKCQVLSGGEKSRVALAKLLLSPANFLILDEPTNHLDADSRAMLLEALQGYAGTLVLVSHDRSFMLSLVNSVLEVVPQEQPQSQNPRRGAGGFGDQLLAAASSAGSKVLHNLGSYEDYLAQKLLELQEAPSQASPAAKVKAREVDHGAAAQTQGGRGQGKVRDHDQQAVRSSATVTPPPTVRRDPRKDARKRELLEQEISLLERRQSELLDLIALPQTYNVAQVLMGYQLEQRELEASLHQKIAQWEGLCE